MKKILALILAMLMIIGTFVACDNNGNSETEKHTEETQKETEKETESVVPNINDKEQDVADDKKDDIEIPGDDNVDNSEKEEMPTITESTAGLEFELNEDGKSYTVVGIGTCTESKIVIDGHDGLPVTCIGDYAFEKCSFLINITIGDSIMYIGYGAFRYCDTIENMMLGSAIVNINDGAFASCYFKNVYYRGNIADWCNISFADKNANPMHGLCNFYIKDSIGKYVLLTQLVIPNSVTDIKSYAFFGCCNLMSVTIPNSIKSIGEYAFGGCIKLVEVINKSNLLIEKGDLNNNGAQSDNEHAYYALAVHSEDSKIVEKDRYWFYTVDQINYLINYTHNEDDIILVLPENYDGKNYIIRNAAFYTVGNNNITSLTIPHSVTSIGDNVFDGLYKLVEIINKSDLTIEVNDSCVPYALEVHQGDSKIVNEGEFLFYICNEINYLVNYMGKNNEIILPINYKGEPYTINRNAFYNNDNIISLIIPDAVTAIGNAAFKKNYNIRNIVIGNNVTSIGENAFYECGEILNITIGNAVDEIGANAFYGTYFDNVYYNGTIAEWCNIVFRVYSTSFTTPMLCDSNPGSRTNNFYFKNLNGEYELLTNLMIPNTVTGINAYAFQGFKISSAIIPDSVTVIGWYAFISSYITSVQIGSNVRIIRTNAFLWSNLTSADFKNTEGWEAGSTSIPSTNLMDKATAAEYLKSTFNDYQWKRTTTE